MNAERIPEVSPVARITEIKNQQIAEMLNQEKKKNSPYTKWIQVNNSDEAYRAEDWLMAHSPAAYRVLRFLASNMDNYNALLCSYKVIQEKLNYSKATVERAIKILKDHNYIGVVKSGTSNVYMINKHLFWKSWGSNYAYAEFDAKVIISTSEQDKGTQKQIQLEIKNRHEISIGN